MRDASYFVKTVSNDVISSSMSFLRSGKRLQQRVRQRRNAVQRRMRIVLERPRVSVTPSARHFVATATRAPDAPVTVSGAVHVVPRRRVAFT